jgi:predicted enzyme related to lactoylglutathione lyase
MSQAKPIGSITWTDLTVHKAGEIRSFYESVVGWKSSEVDMSGYEDFCMNEPESGNTVAGICHARGENANLPAQWLVYITVEDLAKSLDACKRLGGQIVAGPRDMGGQGSVAVIKDPAGAVAALFQAAAS